jgi:hypothetical protein
VAWAVAAEDPGVATGASTLTLMRRATSASSSTTATSEPLRTGRRLVCDLSVVPCLVLLLVRRAVHLSLLRLAVSRVCKMRALAVCKVAQHRASVSGEAANLTRKCWNHEPDHTVSWRNRHN